MSQENLSKHDGVTVTSNLEVKVDWTAPGRYGFGRYREEDLNAVDNNGVTLREKLDKLTNKLVNVQTEKERWAADDESGLSNYDQLQVKIVDIGIKYDLEKERSRAQTLPHQTVGGVAPRRDGSLHSPTVREEMNKPRPSGRFFQDTDQGGRWVEPDEPYTDFSHDIPQTIDPRKPNPPITFPG